MTLTELRYITTLAQEGHFGRAADRCHVSQPTLSVAVKKIETELKVTLFERSKSALHITPIGEKIVQQAQKVLQETALIHDIASADSHQLSSPLRLGAIFSIGPYLFPKLIPKLHPQAVTMPLYIEENYTAVLRRQLNAAELDAIIVALPFTEPEVVTRKLYDEPFVVVMPRHHPWAEQSHIRPEQLPDEEILLLGEGHCFRDQVLALCPALMNKPHSHLGNVLEGSSLETLKHMVATGLGISILPRSALSHLDTQLLSSRPFIEPAPFRSVALAWRASFPRNQAIDLLLASAQSALAGQDRGLDVELCLRR